MRQRIMIAIALACRPKLLIADEPTTALDVTIQAQVLELIADVRAKLGMSVILITHDLGIVAEYTDRVAVMYAGQVVETGPTADVIRSPRHPYTIGLLRSIPHISRPGMRIAPIEGQVPELIDLPPECRFFARCPERREACLKAIPMYAASPVHAARCVLLERERA
jgi:oligopeptide/dipeptide ABC transporter ATP-binding protein